MRCPMAGPSLEYTCHKLVIVVSCISITAQTRLKCSYLAHFRFLEYQNLRISLQKGSTLKDFIPQIPYLGFAPGPHGGTSVPRPPGLPQCANPKYATVSQYCNNA